MPAPAQTPVVAGAAVPAVPVRPVPAAPVTPAVPVAPVPAAPFGAMPGMPSAMPAPMPAMSFGMPPPPAVTAPAPSATNAQPPALGAAARARYRFAEEPIPARAQVAFLDEPEVSEDLCLWTPAKFDPDLKATRMALEAQVASRVGELPYGRGQMTRWLRFSPFELFMEQVLAKKLWTLE